MPTVNERLADAAIDRAVNLQQYANHLARRMIALLNRADPIIAAQMSEALERMPASEFTVERLESLLTSVRQLNRQLYEQIQREVADEMRGLVAAEAQYQEQLFRTVLPAQVVARVGVAAVVPEQVYAAALARPMQGMLLRHALDGLEESRARLIRQTIARGYVEQRTIPEIVRELRGTRAKGYADGFFDRSRRDVETIVRTAVSHYAGFTRDRFFEANNDLIVAVTWTATLDSRTTIHICAPRDGLRYHPVTHKPMGHKLPWLAGPGRAHWNCRSTAVPVTPSWRELGLDIDDMPPGERASMDGAVAGDLTYRQWLERQPASRQDEILGPARGKLLRAGGLEVDRFYTDRGKFLSLAELRARDAKAFERAGL